MRFVPSKSSFCFVVGPIFNKSLEIEGGWGNSRGVSFGGKFDSRGDHAGLRFWLDVYKLYFGLSLTDCRHWNWDENRWYKRGEELEFEGYPHE